MNSSDHGSETLGKFLEKETQKVREQRDKAYGDYHFGFTNLGRSWAAMLSEHLRVIIPDIPAHVVTLMVAEMKMHRASRPWRRDFDDFVDLKNYVDFAADSSLYRREDYEYEDKVGYSSLRKARDSQFLDKRPGRANQ